MALFPNFGDKFYSDSAQDRYIKEFVEDFYNEAITINQAYQAEADIDTRVEAGDQTLYSDYYGSIPTFRRHSYVFNHTRPIVNMISGYQERNRKSTIYTPMENADQQTADQLTKIGMWIYQKDGVNETISEAFRGALITGLNLLQVWIDFDRDPISGDIRVDRKSYNEFIIDPFFRKRDLSDCRAVWTRSFHTRREIERMNPNQKEYIASIADAGRDQKFQFMPENYDSGFRDLLSYDEFYYKSTRPATMLYDKRVGLSKEWTGNEERLREYVSLFPEIEVEKKEIGTVRLAIMVQGKVIYDGLNPLGIDKYPYVPVFAYYNSDIPYYPWRVQGVVRNLRDPQLLYNHRRIIEFDMLESQINSGYFVKEGAVINPDELYATGQGKNIFINEDASIDDVRKIPPGDIPQGVFQASANLEQEMFKISGANEEAMGTAIDDKAAILSMVRQASALTQLQPLYDQLDRSIKLLGQVVLEAIQANFTPGKVLRIINEPPSQEFYTQAFGEYDTVVEEGVNTSTQKQLQFAQMVHLTQLGVPIQPQDLLEASTLQNKQKIIDNMMAAQQQQQQQAQAESQVAMQQLQAQMNLANARAANETAMGRERESRIPENIAMQEERRAKAANDEMQGMLNLVKALKEIQSADLGQIEQLFAITRLAKQNQELESEQKESSDLMEQLMFMNQQGGNFS